MSTTVTSRLRWVPWAVLIAALVLTGGIAALRARAVAEARDDALAAAESHFRSVVADHEHRGVVASRDYERVLIGAVSGLGAPLSPDEVEQRLDVLRAQELAGSMGFFVIPGGGEPHWIGDEAMSVQRGSAVSAGLWVAEAQDDATTIVVGYTTDEGDIVAAVVSTTGLLDLSLPTGDHGHGVTVDLTRQSTIDDPSIVVTAGGSAEPSHTDGGEAEHEAHHGSSEGAHQPVGAREVGADVVPPNGGHLHVDVNHLHEGPLAFVASRDLTLFSEPWLLEVTAGGEFLEIPSSLEVVVLVALGLLSSVSLFGLVHFLVRRVTAEAERRAAEERARVATERFVAGFDASPIGCAVLDATGSVVDANRALERLLDRPAEELRGTSLVDLVAEPFRAQWTARVLRASDRRDGGQRAEVRYQLRPGRDIWVDETATVVIDGHGERHILVQMSDVTEQRSAREELQRRALHDELTGLPNRTLLEDRLQHTLQRSRRDGSLSAVLFMDIDQFKMVNDTLGHGTGDVLLSEIADRLRSTVRDHDTVARFGGDEFVMLCESLATQAEVWKIADRVRSIVGKPVVVDGRSIAVTLSIGIALCGPDDDAEALLRDADLAMYQAKELGRDRAILFERGMREGLIEQLQLEDELVAAIDQGQLELHYQPVVTASTGGISGFEALARWRHPSRGLLAPDAFLPIAAQLGLISTIDVWALETAACQLEAWTEAVPEAAMWTMAVNASPLNFGDLGFPDRVGDALARTGVDPQRITIEITEDAILGNTGRAVDIIRRLRDIGLRVAIDDFGTGYSSLSQLASLDIDVLKIDKSFVTDLHRSPSNEIVTAIVQMAHALGIPTVAEGVETERDLAALKQIGATAVQGYLISKPVPAAEAPALTTERRPSP